MSTRGGRREWSDAVSVSGGVDTGRNSPRQRSTPESGARRRGSAAGLTATARGLIQRRTELFNETVWRGPMTPQQATLFDSVLTTTLMLERLDAELLSGPPLLGSRPAWLARVRERQQLADAVVRGLVALKRRQDPEVVRAARERSLQDQFRELGRDVSDEKWPPDKALREVLDILDRIDLSSVPDAVKQTLDKAAIRGGGQHAREECGARRPGDLVASHIGEKLAPQRDESDAEPDRQPL